eukprot:TRINITY_DN12945_c2_g1_i1.p2 TRINITY_DN12945_c2_g1~~TRINITY_DN12945_c2_g1_i1.p2  ORF type:complete len:127 (+),score=2.63 TRINITY_DN12945_c2_g1_i1:43-423(+)
MTLNAENESNVVQNDPLSPANQWYPIECSSCGTQYTTPPTQWDCKFCQEKYNKKCKVWQNDSHPLSKMCCLCVKKTGFMSRHHCRNCGRVMCGPCVADIRLDLKRLGYPTPQKVCLTCHDTITSTV